MGRAGSAVTRTTFSSKWLLDVKPRNQHWARFSPLRAHGSAVLTPWPPRLELERSFHEGIRLLFAALLSLHRESSRYPHLNSG